MTGPEEEFTPRPTGGVGAVAFAWLPAGDYEQATMLWPDFAGSDRVAGPDGPLPHPQYCGTMQHILVEYAEAGLPPMVIAPCGWRRSPPGAPNTGTSPIQPAPGPNMPPTWQRPPTTPL
ncbi:hypothetical protein [Mycobacterium sp. JS623]|uniref:hypothetical protein n=1 Tax=Mycobacterium sp. JS623 TaxID=212767 RepID=UPI0003119A74|nr:hypothetical protein [Mycobacterium sp. JS623]